MSPPANMLSPSPAAAPSSPRPLSVLVLAFVWIPVAHKQMVVYLVEQSGSVEACHVEVGLSPSVDFHLLNITHTHSQFTMFSLCFCECLHSYDVEAPWWFVEQPTTPTSAPSISMNKASTLVETTHLCVPL
ncbi:hypothetical protein BDQ12DRAFT_728095 [Crucibulum laeve]|uniref:Uncharacterized protein n=1 Tax=Crucibulum laeve TaxID=68775 RepID=A0A5C3LLB7_9AGAR|nr:hypothetical protein BDQ12DRAFT_728095 [Crucibulum laeve]